jgi:glutathione synthase/RimK-type ligase-like ATP-grasp enzyme
MASRETAMILVCGSLADHVTELVCARLADCGYPYRLLQITNFPSSYQVSATLNEEHPRGYISNGTWRVDLDELTGVFVRLHGWARDREPPHLRSRAAAAIDLERLTSLTMLLDGLACPVVNRLLSGMSNYSKPYQALLIRECGLLTPATLVTNDPDAARQFIDQAPGDVICKALSGEGSIVRRVGSQHMERLESLRNGPAQFQHRIWGENIRVHNVGDRLFATRVRSEAVDYRHPFHDEQEIEMEPGILPDRVEAACLRLVKRLGLALSGIDLMRTANEEYYCFEVNPAPAFLFYEKLAGQPISLALADLLHGPGPSNARSGPDQH